MVVLGSRPHAARPGKATLFFLVFLYPHLVRRSVLICSGGNVGCRFSAQNIKKLYHIEKNKFTKAVNFVQRAEKRLKK